MRTVLYIVLAIVSLWLENEGKQADEISLPRSISDVIFVANRSVSLGLTREEAIEMTMLWRDVISLRDKTRRMKPEKVLVENEALAGAVRDYLGATDAKKLDAAAKPRGGLHKIRIPLSVGRQIVADKFAVISEVMSHAMDANDFLESVGEPYVFKHVLLAKNDGPDFADFHADVPDAESVRVLSSSSVQVELNCT